MRLHNHGYSMGRRAGLRPAPTSEWQAACGVFPHDRWPVHPPRCWNTGGVTETVVRLGKRRTHTCQGGTIRRADEADAKKLKNR